MVSDLVKCCISEKTTIFYWALRLNQRNFSEDLTREYLAAEIRDFQRSKNQKTKIYKNLEVIGILQTSKKAKSNSVYPTLLRGEKCLSYKIGEKWYNLEKRVL